eukprot:200573-Lingulodinium_polyedra.AAC.1
MIEGWPRMNDFIAAPCGRNGTGSWARPTRRLHSGGPHWDNIIIDFQQANRTVLHHRRLPAAWTPTEPTASTRRAPRTFRSSAHCAQQVVISWQWRTQ